MEWVAASLTLLSISLPLAATIYRARVNGGKLDKEVFFEYREEQRRQYENLLSQFEALKILIIRGHE